MFEKTKVFPELVTEMKRLSIMGLSHRQIAQKVNLHHTYVSRLLRKEFLKKEF